MSQYEMYGRSQNTFKIKAAGSGGFSAGDRGQEQNPWSVSWQPVSEAGVDRIRSPTS